MAITRAQAARGTKVRIPTRKTYHANDDLSHSSIVQIAKDLGRDHLFIASVEEAVEPYPEKVILVLALNDSGDWFSLNDLELY
jgi:hypothetical protein